MSFFDALARFLGLSEPAPHDVSAADGASDGHGPASPPHVQGVQSPYADLWSSVDRHLAQFMVHSVLPHRQFEPDDVFKLVRIQVAGTTPVAETAKNRKGMQMLVGQMSQALVRTFWYRCAFWFHFWALVFVFTTMLASVRKPCPRVEVLY